MVKWIEKLAGISVQVLHPDQHHLQSLSLLPKKAAINKFKTVCDPSINPSII